MGLTGIGRAEGARRARVRQGGAIRRAREKAARTDKPRLTLDEVFAKFNGYCQICGLPVPRDRASIEHPIPISKGGPDDETNQVLAHASPCNAAKGNRGPRKKGLRRTPLRAKPKSKIPPGYDDVF